MPDQRISPTTKSLSTDPSWLARTRLWLGDLNGARETCEHNLDPLAAPSLQQVGLTGALAWVACVEGLLTEADHLADRALKSAESMDWPRTQRWSTRFALGGEWRSSAAISSRQNACSNSPSR